MLDSLFGHVLDVGFDELEDEDSDFAVDFEPFEFLEVGGGRGRARLNRS